MGRANESIGAVHPWEHIRKSARPQPRPTGTLASLNEAVDLNDAAALGRIPAEGIALELERPGMTGVTVKAHDCLGVPRGGLLVAAMLLHTVLDVAGKTRKPLHAVVQHMPGKIGQSVNREVA